MTDDCKRFIFFRHQNFCKKGKFVSNVHHKKTFSGVYTNLIPTASYMKPIKPV